ncbi:hypothetical protein DVR12_19450 [Chitinophaga silvatica]|uniref:Uncharacterized protein n=1 Tax=Chitinophaga silvatica TaxID=2282649 RepID=A0A3E1Y714_9BACT|nr:hypothetical protein DVR12_19450 [Chitinophaga silvatica]
MLKAKLSLVLISVLTIIGGAIGYKFPGSYMIYTKTTVTSPYCNSILPGYYTTAAIGATTYTFCVDVPGICDRRGYINRLE